MKFIFTALVFINVNCMIFAFGQNVASPQDNVATYVDRCGNQAYEEYLRSKDPLYDMKRQEFENSIAEKSKSRNEEKLDGTPQLMTQYTIPVVFHVIYNTAAQNVPDAQLLYLLDQLNQDWSRTNSDVGNTPTAWQSIAANMNVQFCLALKDPNGNTTTGILRKSTSTTIFTYDDKVKSVSTGGDDPWDATKYMNIWVCYLGTSLKGYGTYPPVSSVWGTVIDYTTVGSLAHPNSAGGSFAYGRTLTHEISHCFNLFHVWGNVASGCSGNSDSVTDTPCTDSPSSGCPTGVVTAPGCAAGSDGSPATNAAPGRMYQNYMDYTNDVCYNMFTAGQRSRVQTTISSSMLPLTNNAATACSSSLALDGGVSSIISPVGNYCAGPVIPVVKLQNFGASTLTSCVINYHLDANPNQTQNWTGSLATGASINITLPSLAVPIGTHTFTSSSSNPNSGTDGNATNDKSTSVFTIANASSPLPLIEGFESSFPPAGWYFLNTPSNVNNWQQNTTYGSQGSTKSAYFNNCNPADTTAGLHDQLRTVNYDFSNATSGATMTFDVGYAPYSATVGRDTLAVYYSTDCGTSWTKIYKKGGATLATVPCVMNNTVCTTYADGMNCFAPKTSAAWRNESISLSALAGQPIAMFAFEDITDYGSNIFMDNINIMSGSAVGLNEVNLNNMVSIYPNPSSGIVFINLKSADLGKMEVKVFNLVGEEVFRTSGNSSNEKQIILNLSNESNGIYFVEVNSGNGKLVKKIVLDK